MLIDIWHHIAVLNTLSHHSGIKKVNYTKLYPIIPLAKSLKLNTMLASRQKCPKPLFFYQNYTNR